MELAVDGIEATTMEEWKEFVPDTMRTGLPPYYSTFHRASEVAQRIAGIYAKSVERGMLSGRWKRERDAVKEMIEEFQQQQGR